MDLFRISDFGFPAGGQSTETSKNHIGGLGPPKRTHFGTWLATCCDLNATVQIEQKTGGLEVRLRVSGLGRFCTAGFLAVWLTFWAVGEGFVLWFLGVGTWALVTGNPPGHGHAPLSLGAALPVGLFLLFWLALWTLGGLGAGLELLRLLFGRDRFLANPAELLVVHSCGFFRRTYRAGPDTLRRFYLLPSRKAVIVETRQGGIELTRLGTEAERDQLAKSLNAYFAFRAEPSAEGVLPACWREGLSPEHDKILMPEPGKRRRAALLMWILFGLVSSAAVYVISAAMAQPTLWGIAVVLVALASAIGWGALWLGLGRNEWKLENSRLVLQRRFGTNCRRVFEAVALELLENNSRDGEPWYELAGVAKDAPAATDLRNSGKHRRVIHRTIGDPTEPRNFALWLSHRCNRPFLDLTTPESKRNKMSDLLIIPSSRPRLACPPRRLQTLFGSHPGPAETPPISALPYPPPWPGHRSPSYTDSPALEMSDTPGPHSHTP